MSLFHLDDVQWQAVQDHCLSAKRPGRKPRDARLVLSGIIHVLRAGLPWRDCPAQYGPASTVFNYYNQLHRRGLFDCIIDQLCHNPALPPIAMQDGSPLRDYRRHDRNDTEGAGRPAAAGRKRSSACAACPVAQRSFCGKLLHKLRTQPHSPQEPLRQIDRTVRTGGIIQPGGESTQHVKILCQGWAARIACAADGRRQILSFVLPGDILSSAALFGQGAMFEVQALTPARYAVIAHRELRDAILHDPQLARAWGDVLTAEMQASYQAVINLADDASEQRLARLIVHLMQRLAQRNFLRQRSSALPLTEQVLVEALALPLPAVRQALQRLQAEGGIEFAAGRLIVKDLPALQRIAGPAVATA